MVFVATHGEENGLLHAYDQLYPKNLLWRSLSRSDHWRNRPKLFFVQACRGSAADRGVFVQDSVDGSSLPSPTSDILVFYSTFEGFPAFKNPSGSFFLRTLMEELSQSLRSAELLDTLAVVTRRMAFEFESNATHLESHHRAKQMPVLEFAMTRKLAFGLERGGEGRVEFPPISDGQAIVFDFCEGESTSVEQMGKILTKFGFKTERNDRLPWNKVESRLQQASLDDFDSVDCLLVAFIGPCAKEKVLIGDSELEVDQALSYFFGDVCPGLASKPKIFLLIPSPSQGSSMPAKSLLETKKMQAKIRSNKKVLKRIPITANFLVLHPCFDENDVVESSSVLSFFNQALGGLKLNEKVDFVDLLTSIFLQMSEKGEPTPCLTSTLTKRLTFALAGSHD